MSSHVSMHCYAPGKLILSGEHSVLYDCPALSMATALFTHCHCDFEAAATQTVTIELTDYQQKYSLPYAIWQKLALDIEARYRLFTSSKAAIQTVLSQPLDLLLTTLYHFNDLYSLKSGHLQLRVHSEIPRGRGLGSSASVIVSVLKCLFLQHQITPTTELLFTLARTIEARQHGRSSGLDPATIIHGGLLKFQAGQRIIQPKSHALQAWLIDTGKPDSSTGETVQHVARLQGNNTSLWKRFCQVTEKLIQAWDKEQTEDFLALIHQNQELLEHLGVVPAPVSQFIQRLQSDYQATAKICGAGSVRGEQAGMLICFSPEPPQQLCDAYGYSWRKITIAKQGAQCQSS